MKRRLSLGAAVAAAALLTLTGCVSDADRVSENISTDAEQFKVLRRITFVNGITDRNILAIEGYCSFDPNKEVDAIDITCKTGPGKYIRDSMGLSDNVTYVIEQANENASSVSKYHYKVVLKPENALPAFDIELGNEGSDPGE